MYCSVINGAPSGRSLFATGECGFPRRHLLATATAFSSPAFVLSSLSPLGVENNSNLSQSTCVANEAPSQLTSNIVENFFFNASTEISLVHLSKWQRDPIYRRRLQANLTTTDVLVRHSERLMGLLLASSMHAKPPYR